MLFVFFFLWFFFGGSVRSTTSNFIYLFICLLLLFFIVFHNTARSIESDDAMSHVLLIEMTESDNVELALEEACQGVCSVLGSSLGFASPALLRAYLTWSMEFILREGHLGQKSDFLTWLQDLQQCDCWVQEFPRAAAGQDLHHLFRRVMLEHTVVVCGDVPSCRNNRILASWFSLTGHFPDLGDFRLSLPEGEGHHEEDEGGNVGSGVPDLHLLSPVSASVGNGVGDVCSLCQEEVRLGQDIHRTPCCHSFHTDCDPVTWWAGHSSCPNCRRELVVGDEGHLASAGT